jgi:hypothetical protein
MFREGVTVIGDAVSEMKRRVPLRDVVETYVLLGDPALKLALPSTGTGD